MATLETITALFVGKTVASVDLSRNEEYAGATQVSSITFTDGTTLHFGGEHDCAYLDGMSINGEYQGGDADLEIDLPEEDEPEEDEPASTPNEVPEIPLLRDALPAWAVDLMERSPKHKEWLDHGVLAQTDEWPVDRPEKRHIKTVWRILGTDGRTRVVGIHEPSYIPGFAALTFAIYASQISAWVPTFGEDLER